MSAQNNISLYNFLDRQIELFKGNFLTTRASMDQEAIHQMRVAVKKINAIYKLKKHIDFPVTIDKKLFDIISAIYGSSGKLRDVQLQHNLLYHYRKELKFGFTALQVLLNESETELEEQLMSVVAEIDPASLEAASQSSGLPENLQNLAGIERESIIFIYRKIEKIEKLMLLIQNEKFVHELRKQVKQLFFVLQFLHSHFPESTFGNYDLKPFQLVGDRLGQWNDRSMFIQRINAFVALQEPNFISENAEYYLLLKSVEDDKRSLLKNVDLMLYMEMINLKALFPETDGSNQVEIPKN
ncbi:MAG: CHAD domain-containing protein [Bacteroidales bacterium]|nr:CHAD domain-containing protein [Bacteroidales bacterium]